MKKDNRSNYEKMYDRLNAQGKIKTLPHKRYKKFANETNKGMEEFEIQQRLSGAYTILHMNDFVMF